MNEIICHDVTKPFPLDDESVDCVITSPPYWGLRDYGVDGQLGLEPHPQMFIDHMVQISREIRRVLKKKGSYYLNLGDTYFGSPTGINRHIENELFAGSPKGENFRDKIAKADQIKKGIKKTNWLQPKQLMLMPSRVAIALQNDGWILRNDIIWHKPNPMPSSVKDRLNCTYEHVFHFVKSRKYYYNLDAIREPHKVETWGLNKNGTYRGKAKKDYFGTGAQDPSDIKSRMAKKLIDDRTKIIDNIKGMKQAPEPGSPNAFHDKGKNPGDVVWESSKTWKELQDKKGYPGSTARVQEFWNKHGGKTHPKGKNPGDFWEITTKGFTGYSDDYEHFAVFPKELIEKPMKASVPKGGVVLDPFGGRGTVGKVARELGLNYILFDIKEEYCELARLYIAGQKYKIAKNQERLFDHEK